MTLTISCPDCQRSLRVPEKLLGQAVKCPSCAHTFVAPEGVEVVPSRPVDPPPRINYEDEQRPSERPPHDDVSDEVDEVVPRRSPHPREKPGKVQAIAIMTLIGGIYACLWSVGWAPLSGFACCLWPGAYYGLVMGIMAIKKGANLLGDQAYRVPPPQGIAIMMIINIINADTINLVLGIIVLVFLADKEVKAYFRR